VPTYHFARATTGYCRLLYHLRRLLQSTTKRQVQRNGRTREKFARISRRKHFNLFSRSFLQRFKNVGWVFVTQAESVATAAICKATTHADHAARWSPRSSKNILPRQFYKLLLRLFDEAITNCGTWNLSTNETTHRTLGPSLSLRNFNAYGRTKKSSRFSKSTAIVGYKSRLWSSDRAVTIL
jgi:hypothetical protein